MADSPTTWAIYLADVLRAGLAFGVFAQAGLLVILLLGLRSLSGLERACLGLGLGLGLIALQMLGYGMVGLPFSFVGLVWPWLAVWLIYSWKRRSTLSTLLINLQSLKPPRLAFTWAEALLFIVLVATLSVVLLNATVHPLFEWDGWAIWDLKARAFFHSRSLFPYVAETYYQLSHLEYPLLQPLAATFLYLTLGKPSDLALLIPAALYISLAGIFYAGVRRLGASTWVSLLLTLGYAWMPNTLFWSRQFYAETALLFYVLASVIYIFTFLRTPQRDWLLSASLMAGLATQVKVEGLALVLPALVVLLLKALAPSAPARRTWQLALSQYAGLVLGIYLPWFVYQRQITTAQGHLTGESFAAVSQNLYRLPEIIGTALQWTLQPALMGAFVLLFPATLLLVLLNFRRHRQMAVLYLALQVAAALATYSLFFFVFPQFLSVENFGRYLLAFTNTVYWLFAWQVAEVLGESSTTQRRMQRMGVGLLGVSVLIFTLGADLWPGSFPLANFYARPLDTARYVFGRTPELFPQSPRERQQILDARVGGPAYGRLIQILQATTPENENIAILVTSEGQTNYLLQRSYYLLYPRKIYIVRDAQQLTPEFRTNQRLGTVLVYDRELQPGEVPGQPIYQAGPRFSILRFQIDAAALGQLPGFTTAPIQFAAGLTLLGYQSLPPFLDDEMLVIAYWQATQTVAQSYTVFVHAVALDGFMRAQHDSWPVLGQLPTYAWSPGLIVQDAHAFSLPRATWADSHICLGLYDSQTLERLQINSAPAYQVADERACQPLRPSP